MRRLRGIPDIRRTSVATNWRFKIGKRFAANVKITKIDELGKTIEPPSVQFEKIKGRSGRPENERCDELAVQDWKKIRGEC
ncbi:MAG: hypothetical protein IJE97_14470 [Thermoguttaceae bacterium]|nr:hypothetical protein [Thermoguttaceae bacterium]